ncbi:MAG: hypothetical protein U9Q62_04255 [Campylobacterota bacterium]|nr:hypothetical protein [Campylobacterota bacterium]
MKNNWIELENGELLLFLHQHLPILQAKSHHEFNGLGPFLRLLDYLITNKFTNETPFIDIRISDDDFKHFGSGKYYKNYIENFFVGDPDYFFSGDAYKKPKRHWTLICMADFIVKVQEHLIKELGEEKYFKPVRINLNNPLKKPAYSIPFKSSKFLNKSLFDLFINRVGLPDNFPLFDENTPVLPTNKQLIKRHYDSNLSERQIRSLQSSETIYTFDIQRVKSTPNSPSKIQLNKYIHTKINIDPQRLKTLMSRADGFDLNMLAAIQRYFSKGNPLLYKEINRRLYATADINNGPLLQGLPKALRHGLFKGYYQYDLTASAPTILHQLYQKHCKAQPLKAVQRYTDDRNALRGACAQYLIDTKAYDNFDEAKKDVKEVITAIFYGSFLSNNSNVSMSHDNRKALSDTIPSFKALADEAKQMFDELYAVISSDTNSDGDIQYESIVLNPYKDAERKKKRSKGSVLSEIYCYHETQILRLVLENFPDVTLLIHDGFIIDHKIWYDSLEELIEEKFGLSVKYDEEML